MIVSDCGHFVYGCIVQHLVQFYGHIFEYKFLDVLTLKFPEKNLLFIVNFVMSSLI